MRGNAHAPKALGRETVRLQGVVQVGNELNQQNHGRRMGGTTV